MDYADPGRLDVHGESPLSVQQATAGIYSGLLQYDPVETSKVVPDLAERYEASADGLEYTFYLRKGISWHDGKPLTVEDVKTSLDRILGKLDPKFRSPRCGAMLRPLVESVSIVDASTIKIRLKFPAATFIPSIASAWCRILPKHILDQYGDFQRPEAQIGTGPFKFKRYERGNVIEWEKNADYFVKGRPYLDGVKQYILVDSAARIAAAKAGRIHLWDTWPVLKPSQAEEIRRARGEEVILPKTSINTWAALYLNVKKSPYDIPEVRRAVNLAIDRQAIVERVWEGVGVPCAILDPKLVGDYALPLDEVFKFPGCRQPKDQDVAEARSLVAKRFPNGVDVEAAVRTVGDYVDRASLVVEDLRRIGIRATLRTFESAAGYTYYGKSEHTMITMQDRAMVISDPDSIFSLLYHSEGHKPWTLWGDPKVDQWIDEEKRTLDPVKRREIIHRLQRYLWLEADAAIIPVGWVEGIFYIDKRVNNYHLALTVYDNNTFREVWLSP
jgi:peptide/nickel transport system substrate-binding protein